MKLIKQLSLAISLFGISAAVQAAPITLDFESVSNSGTNFVEQDGYRFFVSSGGVSLHNHSAWAGTTGLSLHPYNPLTLARVDNSAFSLISLTQWFGNPSTIVTATTSAGGTFSFNMTDNLTYTPGEIVSFAPALFSNVISVQFANTSNGYSWGVDDFVVDAASSVPEPTALTLLGLGFVSLALSRRRKQRS